MKNCWKKWIKFWASSKFEKTLFIKSYVILLFLVIGLKILPFSVFRKLFRTLINFNSKKESNDKIQKLKVQSILRASNSFPFEITCLSRSLALKFLLSSNNLISLKIGVQKNPSNKQFEAHAWIEDINGQIIIGEVPQFSYLPLWEWN